MRRKIVLTGACAVRSARPRINSVHRTTGSGMMTASGDRPKNSNVATTSVRPRINREDKPKISNGRRSANGRNNSVASNVVNGSSNARSRNNAACRISAGRLRTSKDDKLTSKDAMLSRRAAIRNNGRRSANGRNRKTVVDWISNDKLKQSGVRLIRTANEIGNDVATTISAGLRTSSAYLSNSVDRLKSNAA